MRIFSRLILVGSSLLLLSAALFGVPTHGNSAPVHFERVKNQHLMLRDFLYRFPKGGELHTHLDGAVYAESYINWAAQDGKCIDLATYVISAPPCNTAEGRPLVAEIQLDADKVNRIIDAFSVRNYERRGVSGHDQVFATFLRYLAASFGREGSMLAEVTARAARQNTLYLEIMQSYGMDAARRLAQDSDLFDGSYPLSELVGREEVSSIVASTLALLDRAERQWRAELGCNSSPAAAGCAVEVRYLAQVIRTFPKAQVLAQTLLAFMLIEQDPRYVGLNFVAPEDDPRTLRDYTLQMQIIRDLAGHFPQAANNITLHAGELALPLVAPEQLRSHIFEAVHIAGASRIGHGVDIIHEQDATNLLQLMAERQILVEINLTSNAVILGIEGDEHPFNTYRSFGVPLALSTDDEGVARIDLTHEYMRAVRTYNLSYDDVKELSRNALAYSFLAGDSLFNNVLKGKKVAACTQDQPLAQGTSAACKKFLQGSEKARLQWLLEQRFKAFEAGFSSNP